MSPGLSIGHFKLLAKLGEGGMGAVYRATDTKLNRDVAIKVLPQAFAQDSGRMARFEREAQVLASLNHPNIAAIYGIEQGALVMELVEGEDLKGPVPLDTALAYAGQIAAALEAAHEKGVVHRDLKPANIRVTPDGTIKLLDFGLAKTTEQGASASTAASPTMSPTLSLAMTQAGMILGTAAYMSPEQVRGNTVDQRSDIWAFGVVLWEMLTGRRMFNGPTVSDILAGVLKSQPDLNAVPAQVRPLLAACLERDPRQRLRHIGDWRRLIAEPAAAAPAKRRWALWIAAAGLLILAVASAAFFWRQARPEVRHSLAMLDLDAGGEVSDPAISRDGRRLAFVVNRQLAVRELGSPAMKFLPNTENAEMPFFSPDGKSLGYFAGGALRTASLEGDQRTVVCPVLSPRGGVWGDDGAIYFSDRFGDALTKAAAGGGKCELIEASKGAGAFPQVLPVGKYLLLSRNGVYAFSLERKEFKLLVEDANSGRFLAGSNRLFFHRRGVIYSVRLDPKRMQVSGNPIPVFDGVQPVPWQSGSAVRYDIAGPSGTLVYREGNPAQEVISWLEADGRVTPLIDQPAQYQMPSLSPDGSRLAFSTGKQAFVYDIGRRETKRLIAQQGNLQDFAVWSPDGETIAMRADALISLDLATGVKLEIEPRAKTLPWSFAPDGSALLGFDLGVGGTRRLRVIPVEKTTAGLRYGAPQPLDPLPGDQSLPAISPDGKWVAFSYRPTSDGRFEVFVAPYRPGDASEPKQKWQVSFGGGSAKWPKGGAIFFISGGYVMKAPYTVENGVFLPGKPRRWSEHRVQEGSGTFDVTSDGRRVVAIVPSENQKPQTHLRVLLNVVDELASREAGGQD